MVHPECKNDEIFYANVDITKDHSAFNTIPFTTKRLGMDALSNRGCLISQLNPVFIKKAELDVLMKLNNKLKQTI